MNDIVKYLIDQACKRSVEEFGAKVDFAICFHISAFDDDVWTVCADCGKKICHRPYLPEKLPKVCVLCGLDRAGKDWKLNG